MYNGYIERKGQVMTRVNVSIDAQVLAEIDGAAAERNMNRSEYLEHLWLHHKGAKEYADELAAEIEVESVYEKRREKKADSFYMLYGFVTA